jgi:glycosyltransferase involved in cell wall biosynthesis
MKKLKVLLITNELAVGGSEIVIVNTAQMLIQYGHHVDLVCQGNIKELTLDKKINLHFNVAVKFGIRTKIIREFFLRRYILQLERKVKKYDLILSDFNTRRKFLPPSLLQKTYFYLHFDYKIFYLTLLKKDKDKAAKLKQKIFSIFNGKNILAVSEGANQSLLQTFNVHPKKIVTFYNFFDFQFIRKLADTPLPKPVKKPYIVHVARFDLLSKRQDLLFETFKKIPEPYHLVLLTKPSEKLKDLIASYGLTNRVTVAGFQANPFNWIKNAALLVSCSDFEGFGNVLVESLICGTPVVSTNCPSGPNEILIGTLAKYLVPCGNSDLLKAKILEVLADKPTIPSEILERFSFEKGHQALLSLIN